ncbi:AMP-binding enzyme family protein [Collimonas fungivorans]|uniref:AMP-binding enzyme family protein n=1 Tax=Collimonas fungivorans TaxID=158899 RepID=A0A127P8Z1_9BURK|nr:AMP-binding protein [Collimonas fungivorans]AMO94213.1 AMP-binding enzyme family protein [Collimonas fungivorans]
MNGQKNPVQMLLQWASQKPDMPWLFQPVDGQWQATTWGLGSDQIRRMAAALKAMDWEPGSRICISGRNTAHWIMADLAIAMAGHVSVGMYPKQAAATTRYIFEHSEAKAVFLGPMPDADDFMGAIPESVRTISFPYQEALAGQFKWDELVAANQPMEDYQAPSQEALMTLIYTSGTTGNPKGVMLSYGNVLFAVYSIMDLAPSPTQERYFSYMPLAHAFERFAIAIPSCYNGGEVHFLENVDKMGEQLAQVAPTRFFGVPLVYSRIQNAILHKMPQRKLDRLMAIPLLRNIIRRKIRTAVGLQNTRICLSGAAPIPVALLDWYRRNLGLEVLQGYAPTEASVYSSACLPGNNRSGSVGKPPPNAGFRLSDEGEILFKHPGLMMGYYKDPESTRAAFTADGYLRTGDKGRVDQDGYLYITGRVKDIFKTAKGKYVAPAPIECSLARNTDLENLLFIGSGMNQPVMAVTLTAAARSKPRAEVEQQLIADMALVNATLEPHEKIAKCVVLKEAWSIDNGLMTPTMKVKRGEVEKRYAALMEKELQIRNAVGWE